MPTNLPTLWRTKADDYLRAAKGYQCRSNSEVRAGYVKGAAVLRMCADQLDAAYASSTEAQATPPESSAPSTPDQPITRRRGRRATGAMAEEHADTEAGDGQAAPDAEPADQDAGQLDVSGLRSGNYGTGS